MKKHGCLWWVCIGWWWVVITLPFRIPVWLFKRAKKTTGANVQDRQETHKVAGVSYRQEALEALGTKNPDFAKTKQQLQHAGLTDEWVYEYSFNPKKVELVPETDNPHSENGNAVKVVVDGQHIGYIKSGSSAHVLKLIKEDRIQQVECFIGGGRSKILTAAGCVETEKGVSTDYTLETEEVGFYARIIITKKP